MPCARRQLYYAKRGLNETKRGMVAALSCTSRPTSGRLLFSEIELRVSVLGLAFGFLSFFHHYHHRHYIILGVMQDIQVDYYTKQLLNNL